MTRTSLFKNVINTVHCTTPSPSLYMHALSAGYPKVIFEGSGVDQKENRNEKSCFKDCDNCVLELSLAAKDRSKPDAVRRSPGIVIPPVPS